MAFQDRSIQQLKTRLNTLMRNISVVSFTDAEITEALATAINDDEHVYSIDRDASLTTIANTYSYALPQGFETLLEVRCDVAGDGLGREVGIGSWRVVGGNLEFNKPLPSGKALYLYGKHKLTDSDLIPQFLQKYILHLSAIYLLELLLSGKITRFLKNATTVAELQAAIQHHEGKAQQARQKLPNRWSINL